MYYNFMAENRIVMSVRIPLALRKQLRDRAKREGMIFERLVQKYLEAGLKAAS